MFLYLVSFLFILMIFEGAFNKITLIKNSLLLITVIIFFVIQCFNTWSPDLENYSIHFVNYKEDYVINNLEFLHLKIIEFIKWLGGDFSDFIYVYGILIMSFFLFSIRKYSPLPVFVLMNFFFIPFFTDLVQIRFFLGFSIFLFSLQYFDKHKILFSGLCIIASLCHYSLLVFLPFLFLRKSAFFNNQKKSNTIIISGIFLLTMVPKTIIEALIILINPKYSTYLEATSTYIGTLAMFIPFFIINNIALYHYNTFYKNIDSKIETRYKKNIPLFIQLIQYSNYTILLQYFIRDFSRVTMNLYILTLIYFSIIFYIGWSKKYNEKKVMFLKTALLCFSVIVFYFTFLFINDGKYFDIIDKTFSSNSVLQVIF
jgi:hypothetical protein